MESRILDWLSHYGTPAVFLAQLLGIFGVPIPDELLLTTAGVLVRKGELSPAPTLVAAVCGCAAGITVSYVLGRTVGAAALQRVLHVDQRSLARGQEWFRRLGGWLLLFGYFIPGVRHVTAIAAGSMPLDFWCFAKYAYPGAALWSIFFIGIGYYSGNRWAELLVIVRANVTGIFVALAAILLVYAAVTKKDDSR